MKIYILTGEKQSAISNVERLIEETRELVSIY